MRRVGGFLSRLNAYFLIIIAGIENTERVASDFSNDIYRRIENFPHALEAVLQMLVLVN